ncbi:MAG TPA: Crp/Fnr family transcriptional regulator [Pyrinomonadaceae bacterium]|nr:Crp/Fnr family transcriptional regulator [Pyrinomonadaceae bacterium]
MPDPTDNSDTLSRLRYSRRLKLLRGMSVETMHRFEPIMRTTRRRRGDWIFMLGDPSHTIYFLQKGRIKISALSDSGQELLLEIVGPGEIFGDVAAIQGTVRTTSAQALEDSLLCEIPRKDFESLLATYPEISSHLLKSLTSRLRRYEAQLLSLISQDVSTRVVHALTEFMDFESEDQPNQPVKIRITQQDLANLIGASRQKTWQALKDLEDCGMLRLSYGSILVTAPHKLRNAHQ